MNSEKKYYAFISYSHKDEEWAKWLQHEFEHYHLPTTLNGRTNLPDKFRPIFRDIDELSGGELKPQINRALRESIYLVVICSPNSAKSKYVDEEIREFIRIGSEGSNISNIFPFIVDGIPKSEEHPDRECFPNELRNLPVDIIAGDVTKHGRDHAFIKVLSGTLRNSEVRFSMLWDQFERNRIEEERRERERRNRLLLLESRYLSEKALDVAPTDSRLARLLVLNALPNTIDDPDNRPYCPEAESALRRISNYKSVIFKAHNKSVMTFKVNPSGDKAITASSDNSMKIWDVIKGVMIGEILNAHNDIILDATYSRDGKMIASCSKDCTIRLWDEDTLAQITCIKTHEFGCPNRIEFTNDNNFLVGICSVGYLNVWSVDDGNLIHKIKTNRANDFAIDSEGKHIALATLNFSILIYDLNDYSVVKEIENAHTESLTSVAFSPDGSRIASAGFDGKFKVWNWQDGTVEIVNSVGKVRGAYAPVVQSCKYSSNGKLLVTTSQDNSIRVWSAITGEQIGKTLIGHTDSVNSAYFSKDESYILSASSDGTARIWDLNPQTPYKIIGRARYIPFDSKIYHKQYRIKIESCEIKIIDSDDGSVWKVLRGHKKNVKTAVFSPDGTKVASASYDGTVILWDISDNEVTLTSLNGHSITPLDVSFSPDGSLLATASAKELKVWSVNHSIQLGSDINLFDDIYRITFTDNGEGIIIETEQDYDILCDWEPLYKLISRTRSELSGRDFTEEEKRKYYLESLLSTKNVDG